MRVCNVCKLEKSLNEFYKDSQKKLGISHTCKNCSKKVVAKWHQNNRDKSRATGRKTAYNRKLKVLTYYSKLDTPICSCNGCYVQDPLFLAIDHIQGNGAQQRREEKIKSSHLYNWIVKNNFPDGFQVLCHNCNFAKGTKDDCPVHKEDFIIIFNENNDIGHRIGA